MSIEVVSAQSLDEACAALADADDRTRVLAGGTDLLVELQNGRSAPLRMIDIAGVDALRGVHREADGVRIGALTSCTELASSPTIAAHAPMLRQVALDFAAPQIRNRATLGGNLGTASPAGDFAPALLAMGASVRLRSRRGARDVPMSAFFTAYRRHAGARDELIESVFVPTPPGCRTAWRKVGTRGAQSIAKVALAASAQVQDGVVVAISVAAGAVADRTLRLASAQALVGRQPTPAAIAAVARAAATTDVAPIDDVRSTAHYRRHVVQRVLAVMLQQMFAEV
jgi:CO/xanthine dehydrogenase FAD-binding subunit